ncbi:MAG: serine/threonine-protein kinase, partial [Rubrivivax sp.]|nr:serine/threonine-protein kinase [Rubrivivax sp.]
MSPDDDDDRTVIRPPGPPQPPPAPSGEERTMAVGAPPPSYDEDGSGLPIGTYLGEFELTQKLAEGGFGIVYLATDHSLQRRVALKEYMPSSLATRTGTTQVQAKSERLRETFEAGRKSFINEARLLAQFDHRSLLKVYRFWEANGTAYMVMPFIEGTNLKDMLRQMGAPPDEDWLRTLLEPLTEALAVIHAEQCYHRDIAPDNVMMLAGSNRPLLLDFGAARRVIGDMTQALTVILKPGYAPVEQYAEIPGMKQGPWTDVYALAAVVYYAIIGKTPPTSVGRLLNDTYVPLTEAAAGRYSERFLSAIDRALAVRPEQRTQTIGQLRADLGLEEIPPDPYATLPLPQDVAVPPRPAAP